MSIEQQDEWGPWVEHDGKGMPVDAETMVWVEFRDGKEDTSQSAGFWGSWKHQQSDWDWWLWIGEPEDNITRYRLRKTVPDTSVDFPGVGTIPAWPSEPADAEIVGMIRKACKELTGKNATFADDDLRAIVERATPADTDLLRDALEALDALVVEVDRIGNCLSAKGIGATALGLTSHRARKLLDRQER